MILIQFTDTELDLLFQVLEAEIHRLDFEGFESQADLCREIYNKILDQYPSSTSN